MLKILFVLTAAFTLVGCEGSMEKYLRSQASDPEAVQFKDKATYKNWACISVNSKNEYGGYAGFKRYTMRNVADDQWIIYSKKMDCTDQSLTTIEKTAQRNEKYDAELFAIAQASILKSMKIAGVIPTSVNNVADINDSQCRATADRLIVALARGGADDARFDRSAEDYALEYRKRGHALIGGDCRPPDGYTNK